MAMKKCLKKETGKQKRLPASSRQGSKLTSSSKIPLWSGRTRGSKPPHQRVTGQQCFLCWISKHWSFKWETASNTKGSLLSTECQTMEISHGGGTTLIKFKWSLWDCFSPGRCYTNYLQAHVLDQTWSERKCGALQSLYSCQRVHPMRRHQLLGSVCPSGKSWVDLAHCGVGH